MFGGLHRHGWRGAIGLIAAYALVLQAFLAYCTAVQATAQNTSSYSADLFVLCTSQDNPDTPHGNGAPPNAHCPVCTLSAAAAGALPDPISLPLRQAATGGRTPFISAAACISFHRARAGLSRAPPHNA
jgi:hypothetical protein